MGTCPDAEVGNATPVGLVVPRLAPRAREVRDLIGGKAGRTEPLADLVEHRHLEFLGRLPDAADRAVAVEGRARLEREGIGRDVLGADPERFVEVGATGFDRLARNREDQVERKVVEACLPRRFQRR